MYIKSFVCGSLEIRTSAITTEDYRIVRPGHDVINKGDAAIEDLRRRDVFRIIRFLDESEDSNFDGPVLNMNNLILTYRRDSTRITVYEAERRENNVHLQHSFIQGLQTPWDEAMREIAVEIQAISLMNRSIRLQNIILGSRTIAEVRQDLMIVCKYKYDIFRMLNDPEVSSLESQTRPLSDRMIAK